MSNDVKSLINHYAQLGFCRHIQTVCREVVKKRGKDPVLIFWEAYGIAQEGSAPEAIRSLESIRGKRDTDLACVLALTHYHKQARIVDHEAVAALEREAPTVLESASPSALHLAATFYWHVDDLTSARQLVDRILRSDPGSKAGQTLRGWIDLSSAGRSGARGKDNFEKSVHWFENALEGEDAARKELGALMGRAKYYEIKGDFDKALDSLNEVTVVYSWFLPALTEKARILIKTGDWDQAVELARKVLEQDSFDLESQRLLVFELLSRQSNPSAAATTLSDLMDSMDRYEPKNAALYYRVAQPFARLAGRSRQILELTLAMVERARSLDDENSLYAAEFGYQRSLLGEYAAAAEAYRMASKLDESNVLALAGMIQCQIAEGAYEDAEQQLELFRMIQESIGRTSELAFLDALLAGRKNRNHVAQEAALDETCKLHWTSLRDFRMAGPSGADLYQYFTVFNPEFLLDVAKEYLQGYGDAVSDDAAPTPAVSKGMQLLERVTREVPGLMKAQLLLAKTKYAAGDVPGALRVLQQCLVLDPTFSDAHLLMASIGLAQSNMAMADSALERALSHNFQVRDSPVFHRIKARVLASKGDLEGSLRVLEDAMAIPGVKNRAKAGTLPVPQHDRASIYIQLAEVLTELNRVTEATKVVSDALHQFTGTDEEVRVVVANSKIALLRGKVDSAIRMLGNVPFDSPAFAKAQMVKADIYLKHRHDRRLYIKCYEDIVEKSRSEHAYVMLGEAYMNIQMPAEATKSFESALELAPDNPTLAAKVGRALIATHDYRRAVEYYEEALEKDRRSGKQNDEMRSDLTQLFVKLRRFDDAARLLDESLSAAATSDVSSMNSTRDNLLLLAKVHKGTGNASEGISTLLRALELQNKIIMRLRSTNPDLLQEQREEAAKLCHTLAQAHLDIVPPQQDKAMLYLAEAIKALDTHEPSILALATLRLQRGELEECERLCGDLLKHDAHNEQASIMLADIMFRKNESAAAMYHFQQLLEKNPGHYQALYKLIQLLKRAGKLSDAPRFLRLAERASARAEHDPGLKFCKGVYHRYNAEDHEAIKLLNQVRLSGEWGLMATEHMIEIYLSPESPNLWSEEPAAAGDGDEPPPDQAEACRVAEKLLRDIPPSLRTTRHQVYEAYVLIVSMNRTSVEQGIQHLGSVLSEDSSNVRALLALATALMVLRQTPKARNQLKRIAKMQYDSELADQFVQAYVLLADIFIGSGKYDLATEHLQRALKYDKSCSKAWEMMGIVMEKEGAYEDAASHYAHAFQLQNESSAPLGFKLGFNYLKAAKFVSAIDVCHKVLALYPDYPRIRRDILDRARESLRK